MRSAEKFGNCAICGEYRAMTFEHVPPQAAGNKEPVFIRDHRHILPSESPLYGKQIRSNNGLGGHRTCRPCNNNTGSWYGKEYSKVVKQAYPILYKQRSLKIATITLNLKPLNFIKQVIIFHLFADYTEGSISAEIRKSNFILTREQNDLSDKFKIFMYCTFSSIHRFQGISSIGSTTSNEIAIWSEFNFHPFGFIFAVDSPPPLKSMMDITDFKRYPYDEDANINFSLPILNVINDQIGHYL